MTFSEMLKEYSQWQQSLWDILKGAEDSENNTSKCGETIVELLSGGDKLSDFSQMGQNCGGGPLTYNSYPFGQKTRERFPLMIAACSGRESLTAAFKQMQRHMDEFAASKSFPKETVILLTTKWDPAKFEPFEIPFLLSCLDHDLTIVLILVTDYGVTEIPFGRFARKLSMINDNYDLKGALKYEQTRRQERIRYLREIDDKIVYYPEIEMRLHGGTWEMQKECTWVVDLKNRRSEYTVHGSRTIPDKHETNILSHKDVRTFVEKLDNAISSSEPLKSGIMDCDSWELSFEEHTYSGLAVGDFYEMIMDAFETLGI